MKCPVCGFEDSRVVDSRPMENNSAIRRRRECPNCGKRFTTVETLERTPIIVVKKDGTKEMFDLQKLVNGVLKATEKRPVDGVAVGKDIENTLYNEMKGEVTSSEIGEMVMERLKDLDGVSYVRFASVYREFRDIDSFLSELKALKKK